MITLREAWRRLTSPPGGILTGSEIRRQRDRGRIVIDPWDDRNVGPNSYDLALGDELAVYTHAVAWESGTAGDLPRGPRGHYCASPPLRLHGDDHVTWFKIPPEGLCLYPGVLYLGTTVEHTKTYGYVPVFDGRSSTGRKGLCVHLTAGLGDNGFEGHWTLEMTVVHPLVVQAGGRVAQLLYFTPEGRQTFYRGKYQGQSRPEPCRFYREPKRE